MRLEGLKNSRPLPKKTAYCMCCKKEIIGTNEGGLYGRRFCSDKCREKYLSKSEDLGI